MSFSLRQRLTRRREARIRERRKKVIESSDQDAFESFFKTDKKGYWTYEPTGVKCCTRFAKELDICFIGEKKYWELKSLPSTSGEEVANLLNVCWLDVRGECSTKNLTAGTKYVVSFVVMIENSSYGLDLPVTFRLTCDDRKLENAESLVEKPRGKWIELIAGEFTTPSQEGAGGVAQFCMYEYGGQWKKGLVIRGAVIRPTNLNVTQSG